MSSAIVHPPNFTRDPRKGFANVGEMLTAVHRAAITATLDERLRPLAAAGSDEQSAGTQPFGGYLLPAALAGQVLRVAPEADPMPVTELPPMTARS